MRKLLTLAFVLGVCSQASAAFAIDSSETTERLKLPGQQPYIFGDWGGLRTWLNSHGIDLNASYLSESAWDVAGGMARGGTYAGQENLRLSLDWEKIANLNGFSTHIDVVSRQGRNVSTAYVGTFCSKPRKSTAPRASSRRLPTWPTFISSRHSSVATSI
jgi:carbohydrate-selective porin OprB